MPIHIFCDVDFPGTPVARRGEDTTRRIKGSDFCIERQVDRRMRHDIGTFDPRHFNQRCRDHWIGEPTQIICVERRQRCDRGNDRAGGEVVASIEHVDAMRTAPERAAVQLFRVVALADIHDQGDDFCRGYPAEAGLHTCRGNPAKAGLHVGQPLHCRTGRAMTVKRQDDALVVHLDA